MTDQATSPDIRKEAERELARRELARRARAELERRGVPVEASPAVEMAQSQQASPAPPSLLDLVDQDVRGMGARAHGNPESLGMAPPLPDAPEMPAKDAWGRIEQAGRRGLTDTANMAKQALVEPLDAKQPGWDAVNKISRVVAAPFALPFAMGGSAVSQAREELGQSKMPGDARFLLDQALRLPDEFVQAPAKGEKILQEQLDFTQPEAEMNVNAVMALLGGAKPAASRARALMKGEATGPFIRRKSSPITPSTPRQNIMSALDDVTRQQRAELVQQGKPVPWDLQSSTTRDLTSALEGAMQREKAAAPFVEAGKAVPEQLRGRTTSRLLDAIEGADALPRRGKILPFEEAVKVDPSEATPRRIRSRRESGEIINPAVILGALYDRAATPLRKAYSASDKFLAEKVTKPATGAVGKFYRDLKESLPEGGSMRRLTDFAEDIFVHEARRLGEDMEHAHVQHQARKVMARQDAGRHTLDFKEQVLDRIDEGYQHEVYEYMAGKRNRLSADLADMQQRIDMESAYIDNLGEQLVQEGALSREAKAQFKRYLPQLYLDQPAPTRGLFGGKRASVGKNFARLSDKHTLRVPGADVDTVIKIAEEFGKDASGERLAQAVTTDGRTVQVKFADAGTRSAFKKKLQQEGINTKRAYEIEPMPAELREALIDKDAGRSVYHAIYAAKSRLAAAKLFDSISQMPDVVKTSSTDMPGYTRVDQPWAGKLRGKLVRNDVFKYLDADMTVKDSGPLVQGYKAWLRQWKKNKTIWSLPTAVRQYWGNTAFLKMGGVDPLDIGNWKKIVDGWNEMQRGSTFYDEMRENGIILENNLSTADFNALDTILGDKGMSPAEKWGAIAANPLVASKRGRAFEAWAAKKYNVSDQLTRSTLYTEYRRQGMSPKQATLEVNRYTPNPSLAPKYARTISQWGGAPFFMFKMEAARTLKNTAINHPVRFATLLMHFEMMRQLVGAGMDELGIGLSDDEDAAIKDKLGRLYMPTGFRTEDGHPLVANTRWNMITGDMTPGPSRLGEDNFLQYLQGMTGLQESPPIEMARIAFSGQDRYGRQLSRPTAGALEQVWDRAKSYAEATAPAIFPQGIRIGASALGAPNPLRKDPEPENFAAVLASFVAGLDIRAFDAKADLKKLRARRDWLMGEIEESDERREVRQEYRDRAKPLRGASRTARERRK